MPGSGILTAHFSDGATFPLRDAVHLMIVYSDNTATNLVLDEIGIRSTAETMEKLGVGAQEAVGADMIAAVQHAAGADVNLFANHAVRADVGRALHLCRGGQDRRGMNARRESGFGKK